MLTGNGSGGRSNEVLLLRGGYNPQDMAVMRDAIEAVCGELGIARGSTARREAVAKRVMAAYDKGPRQPLNLVHAGLGALELTA